MQGKDEFLKSISDELKPVKRLWSPQLRFIIWSTLSLGIILAIMLFIQPFRAGVTEQLKQKHFLFEALFAILPFISLGFLCLRMAVPGLRVSRGLFLITMSPFILFFISIIYGYMGSPSLPPTMAGKRPYCFYEVLTLSWVPIFIMVYLVRKGHSFISLRLNLMIGLAGSTLPMALMQIACMYDPYHILSHHILGASIVTISMTVLGFYLLKRKN